MFIGICEVDLRANWVHSLKEKRSVVSSIIGKTKHKFNVSIAEIGSLDNHQHISIGFACVSNDARHADRMVRTILNFIENNTEAIVDNSTIEVL